MSENETGNKTVTRQELFEQVWSMPVSALCRGLGISSGALTEICDR